MKRSVDMLLKLKKEDLEEALKKGTCPVGILLFLEQLKEDFKLIIPTNPDPIEQAENILDALFKVARNDSTGFNQEAVDKVDLISQIYGNVPHRDPEKLFFMVDFYQGIDTVRDIDNAEQRIIKQYLDNIISAIRKKQSESVIQSLIKLGSFFKDNYPDEDADKIQQVFNKFNEYKEIELPKINIINEISKAAIHVANKSGKESNTSVSHLLSHGLTVFTNIMGKERIDEALNNSEKTNEIDKHAKIISDVLLPKYMSDKFPAILMSVNDETIDIKQIKESLMNHNNQLKQNQKKCN